eukprot:152117_1
MADSPSSTQETRRSRIGPNYLFHLLDFIVGVMFCVDSYFIISTAHTPMTIPRIALPLYYFGFGLLIILMVFHAPKMIAVSLPFYWTFFGRSLCFIFLSAPLMTFGEPIDIASGLIAAVAGFLYLIYCIATICQSVITTLPPPIFQRHDTIHDFRFQPDKVNQDSDDEEAYAPVTKKKSVVKPQKKWKWKQKQLQQEREKNRLLGAPAVKSTRASWWRRKTKSGGAVNTCSSTGTVADRTAQFDKAITADVEMTDKLNQIKQEQAKDIKTLDAERKQEATDALTQYAELKAAHIKDIDTVNRELQDITKANAVEKMVHLGLMRRIVVKKNVFSRYALRNAYSNKLLNDDDDTEIHDHDEETMYVLNMMNCGLLTKLTEDQQAEFEKLLLYSLMAADKLYIVELTRSNLNDVALEKIMNVLRERSEDVLLFGPEEFKCESNKITNRGMKYIIEYIAMNDKDLRVIKAGHLFTTISSQMCKLCGEVLNEKNEHLLQLSIDIQWPQYQTQIDKGIKRNNDWFREQRNKHMRMESSDEEENEDEDLDHNEKSNSSEHHEETVQIEAKDEDESEMHEDVALIEAEDMVQCDVDDDEKSNSSEHHEETQETEQVVIEFDEDLDINTELDGDGHGSPDVKGWD